MVFTNKKMKIEILKHNKMFIYLINYKVFKNG